MTDANREKLKHNEKQMREQKAPTPDSTSELAAIIEDLIGGEHDYGTCVYAMSIAATAAFNLVARKLGVTGFQASCADMDIIRRTRSLERFAITDASNWLYPQYDPEGKLATYRESLSEWLRDEAASLLVKSPDAHPNVIAHWKKLASWKSDAMLAAREREGE